MTQQNLLILLIVGALIAVILVVGSWVDNGSSNFPQKIKLLEEQEDVQDVLSLSTRKMLFTRDWEERNRIEDYVNLHYPIDFDAPLTVQDRQFEKNSEAWEKLYQKYVDEVCHKHSIPEWQYWQILDEGMRMRWPPLQS